MSFNLANVVPWGRSYDEYISMFSLSSPDLNDSIVGCSDGPASFNSILTRQNGTIVSVDPLYSLTIKQINQRIDETYATVIEQTRANQNEFIWSNISSVEELGKIRVVSIFLCEINPGRFLEKRQVFPHFANRV